MNTVTDLFRLDGKIAVVTGGAKGIGMYYSEALLASGAHVVVADIDPTAVNETTSRLSAGSPNRVTGIEVDVTLQESIGSAVEAIRADFGRVDILVNNAALFSVLEIRPSPWDIPDAEFDRVMATNIRSVYAFTRAVLPLMRGNGWGRIINIASGLAFKGSPPLLHYAASKAAVVNITRSMAPVVADDGITVNAIAPGGTESPTVLEARAARARSMGPEASGPPAAATLLAMRGPTAATRLLNRTEVPEDILGTLIYLASEASDFVTGQTIVVDGGQYFN